MPKVTTESTKKAMNAVAGASRPSRKLIQRATSKTTTTTNVHGDVPSLALDALPVALSSSIEATIELLEKDTMGTSWYDALSGEFDKVYFRKVRRCVTSRENRDTNVYAS